MYHSGKAIENATEAINTRFQTDFAVRSPPNALAWVQPSNRTTRDQYTARARQRTPSHTQITASAASPQVPKKCKNTDWKLEDDPKFGDAILHSLMRIRTDSNHNLPTRKSMLWATAATAPLCSFCCTRV